MSSLDDNLAKQSVEQRRFSAAAGFLSTYWANVTIRSGYCESLGVPMNAYLKQFRAMNDDL